MQIQIWLFTQSRSGSGPRQQNQCRSWVDLANLYMKNILLKVITHTGTICIVDANSLGKVRKSGTGISKVLFPTSTTVPVLVKTLLVLLGRLLLCTARQMVSKKNCLEVMVFSIG
jgi:hypothetical protein